MSLFRSLIAQAKEISLKNELLSKAQDLKIIAAEASNISSGQAIENIKRITAFRP